MTKIIAGKKQFSLGSYGITLARCRDRASTRVEHELAVFNIDIDNRTAAPTPLKKLLGKRASG